jgi:hypothetical protein
MGSIVEAGLGNRGYSAMNEAGLPICIGGRGKPGLDALRL